MPERSRDAATAVTPGAGIAADLPQAVDDVPMRRRDLFGWVIRKA